MIRLVAQNVVVVRDNDHIELYANVTKQNLEKQGLSDLATVSHAPLKDMDINGKTWNWYDLPDLDKLPGKIDMLVVDGPPWKLQRLARYSALPVLFKGTSKNSNFNNSCSMFSIGCGTKF